jgi:hypothetical protein
MEVIRHISLNELQHIKEEESSTSPLFHVCTLSFKSVAPSYNSPKSSVVVLVVLRVRTAANTRNGPGVAFFCHRKPLQKQTRAILRPLHRYSYGALGLPVVQPTAFQVPKSNGNDCYHCHCHYYAMMLLS